ncbi:AraC family transcriptional regulator, partial [gut metagenome]
MKEKLQSDFLQRQYMISKDFEIYYYNNHATPLHIQAHAHNYYEFYFFLEGNVEMLIDKQPYTLQYGDVILIPPGISHKVTIKDVETPYRRFVFWISKEYSNRLEQKSEDFVYLQKYAQQKQKYVFHNDRVVANGIQSRILRLLEEQREEHFGKQTLIELCVNELLLSINRLVYEREHSATMANSDTLYYNVLSYIERNLDADLSLDALAREFYVSKFHIAHLFKNQLGISVHQFITKKRLDACRTAIQGGEGVTRAYRMFGFGDYSCFYRAFKKEYGISPRECQELAP